MNSLEFYASLLEYKKNAGEYTKDEIVEIGIKFKQMPKSEKNWESLARTLGWEGTGESLRSFVNHRIRQLNRQLGIAESMNTTEDYERPEVTSATQELVEKKKALYGEKQLVRDEWTAYRRLMRDEARVESLRQALIDSIAKLEPINLGDIVANISDNIETSDYEAVLLLSDLHIGAECDNFYNKYNLEVAKQRIATLTSQVIEYCNKFAVKTLNICNLGDMIQGIIHTNARIEAELDVATQVIQASEIIAQFLNQINNATNCDVVYRSVIDNHSRIVANKNECIEKEYFSRLIDWYLEERLKNTSIKFANDNIDEGIGKFQLSNNKTVMFAHGHNDDINQAYQHFTGATKQFVDYILLGHYHCEKTKSYQGAKVVVNGSIMGTEQYALSKRLFNEPCQTLLVFNGTNDDCVNISIKV